MKQKTSHKLNPSLIRVCGAVMLAAFAGGASAQVTEMLHETQDGTRDNYTGVIGSEFKVGSSNVVVSHLGVYDSGEDGLVHAHIAGIFNASGSAIVGQVSFATGSGAYLTNGMRWMPLDPPLLLAADTTYVLAADVFASSGDLWKDSFAATNWNPRFIGTNAPATRRTRYSGGNSAWPAFPTGGFGSDTTYGNVTLGYLEIGQPRVGVQSTAIAASAGQAVSLVGFASGAAGISYQWFKAPAILLPGQTSPVLSFASAAVSDSGTYYLTATNSLGGSQSADITLTVSAYPVGIQESPTNLTVLGNYTATFSAVVTGSPPISVQWLRNGTPVSGATNLTYSFTATSANDGDLYSLLASNNIASTPHTATSTAATLTVTPNLALPEAFLHGVKTDLTTNNYAGCVGGSFITRNTETVVTHLGYYATKYTDATHADLADDHTVYIFNADYTTNTMVVVPSGSSLPVVNGYIWAALSQPVVLAPNTTYILGADTTLNDPWGNTYVPDWGSYYTDPTRSSSFAARYNNPGKAPYYGGYAGQIYSAPNMAVLPMGSPMAWVNPTSVTQYVGFSVTLNGQVNGEAPLTAQWYKAPATLLAGETGISLTLASPTESDSGDYYLVCSNSFGTGQSENASVTILPTVGPSIVEDVQSQAVLVYSTVKFSVTVDGTPSFSYQWSFNGNPIMGATNSQLTILNASSANAGNYRVAISSPYGSTNSSVAALSVSAPVWGSYPSSVMGTNLLAYYRFSDVSSGQGVATNMGSLGFAYNGTYEGFYGATDGPLNISNFGPSNPALLLDGSTSDMMLPPLNVRVTDATIAAWVYSGGNQDNDDAIYFHRGGSVFGLSVFPETNSLKYTWAGGQFNFQTGLTLPINQWTLVAMAVTPSNAVVYLQDGTGLLSATNVAAHAPMTFDSVSYVGWDTAGGLTGRYWTGGVDELMIFNRALSAVEINALYLGVPGSATLTLQPSGGNLMLTWPGGLLEEADSVTGPWNSLTGATSPYPVSTAGPMKYYRVKLQ